MKSIRINNRQREALTGYAFICPWIIGFIFLFMMPMLKSFIYSFSIVRITEKGLTYKFAGIQNYMRAFVLDPLIIPALVKSVGDIVYQVPLIIIFSLFISTILNQNYKGRLFIRAIFFLPVIIASGIVISIMKQDLVSQMFLSGSKGSTMVQAVVLQNILLNAGMPVDLVRNIISAANNIFELSWKSGIQILLFLAGLQTIPSQLYEVSKIEGATGWESFWKITFPMLSPILVLNVIYTIIDSFTDYSNDLMKIIIKYAQSLNFSYSSALAWLYFAVIGIVLGIVYGVINKRATYINE